MSHKVSELNIFFFKKYLSCVRYIENNKGNNKYMQAKQDVIYLENSPKAAIAAKLMKTPERLRQ